MSKLTWAKNNKTNFIDRKIEGPLRVKVVPKGDRIKKYGFFTQSSTFGKQEFVKPLINCPADLWLNLYNKLKQENDIMIEVYNVSEDRFCIEMQLVGKYDFYNNTVAEQYWWTDVKGKTKIITSMYEKIVALIESSKQLAHDGKVFIHNDINHGNMIWHNDKLHLIDVDSWWLVDKAGPDIDHSNEYLQEFYDWVAEQYSTLGLGQIKNVYF